MYQQLLRLWAKAILWLLIVSILPAMGQPIPNTFAEIAQKSEASHSDALLIYQSGKAIIVNHYTNQDKPLYIASAGKSLTSLGVGRLVELGLLRSVDEPVATFFPEWKQGRKKEITVRMLLNHTSGLQNNPNASIELEPAPTYKVANVVQLALCAELATKPGEVFGYNNKAVALLGGIIKQASGRRMDTFFEEELYNPMGIKQFDWVRDQAGNPTAHGAFIIRPSDFLKFGELMLNEGKYKGRQIIGSQWVSQSVIPAQALDSRCGLLWWLLYDKVERTIDNEIIDEWRTAGVSDSFLKQLAPIVGKVYPSVSSYSTALTGVLGEDWQRLVTEQLNATGRLNLRVNKKLYGKIVGYYADGYRGNYVVVIPQARLVAVRCKGPANYEEQTDSYDTFPEDVYKATQQLR